MSWFPGSVIWTALKGAFSGADKTVCGSPPQQIGSFVWLNRHFLSNLNGADDRRCVLFPSCQHIFSPPPVCHCGSSQSVRPSASTSGFSQFCKWGTAGNTWMNPKTLSWGRADAPRGVHASPDHSDGLQLLYVNVELWFLIDNSTCSLFTLISLTSHPHRELFPYICQPSEDVLDSLQFSGTFQWSCSFLPTCHPPPRSSGAFSCCWEQPGEHRKHACPEHVDTTRQPTKFPYGNEQTCPLASNRQQENSSSCSFSHLPTQAQESICQ